MKRFLTITFTLLLAFTLFAVSGTESLAASRPGKVTGVTAKTASSGSITLKWKKAAGAKAYQIYKVTKTGSKRIATVKGASKRAYTVKGLKSGTRYCFKIRAINKYKRTGAFSKKVYAKTSIKPGKVTGVTAAVASPDSVDLAWNVTKGASGYQIYMVTEEGSEKIAAVQGSSKTSYTVSDLRSGATYGFKIRAFNTTKEYGSFSETVSVSLPEPVTECNYLAIGNSLTRHGVCDYWWNDDGGMAASTVDKDYVHRVTAYLKGEYDEVNAFALNFSRWEKTTERAATLNFLDPYLDPALDLVTVQLSENATNLDTFEADFDELVKYIREKAPEAKLIIIDDFWVAGGKADMKKRVADANGLAFADLSEIKGKPEYQCGLGTVVYDPEGGEHIVEHKGVAGHPGDLGMEYIANAVIELLK
jgi:hypothetical protein